jgi:integrase
VPPVCPHNRLAIALKASLAGRPIEAMTQRRLTDALLRAVIAPARGRLELADERCAGLEFRITAKGARSWSLRFRDPQTGKLTRVTLGNYPAVGLSAARTAADLARGQVAAGVNPNEAKRTTVAEAPKRTFEALATRYLAEHAKRHKKSWAADDRNLRKHVLPKWRSRDYRSIRRADAVEIVEGLIAAGMPTLANRVGGLLSKIFNFAIDAGLNDSNPAGRLSKRGTERVGRRVLTDAELRLFWLATSGVPPISRRVGLALRLALVTATRAGEASGAHKDEMANIGELANATWTLPGTRVKNERTLMLPLSPLGRTVVLDAIECSRGDGGYLFPSRLDNSRPIRAQVLATAMQRLGAVAKGEGADSWRAAPPTPHDLRRTCRTRFAALGIPREDRDAIMNHAPSDVGGKHYDLYERLKEKRAALDLWSDTLAAILEHSSVPVPPSPKKALT